MVEEEAPGVKELTGGGIGKSMVEGGFPIKRVADNGGAEGGEVDTDLVRAPGLDVAFHAGKSIRKGGKDFPMGDGAFSAGAQHGHLLTVGGATTNLRIECAGRRRGAVDDGDVGLAEVVDGKGLGERLISTVVLSDDHDTGGVHIQPMDDAGALLATNATKVGAMPKESIDQSTVTVAAGGVDDQSGRFIEGQEIIVFVEDREGNVFWDKVSGFCRRKGENKGGTGDWRGGKLGRGAALKVGEKALFCKDLNTGARELGQAMGKPLVKPPLGDTPFDSEGEGFQFLGHLSHTTPAKGRVRRRARKGHGPCEDSPA